MEKSFVCQFSDVAFDRDHPIFLQYKINCIAVNIGANRSQEIAFKCQ